MALQNQIHIYSIDTSAFYNDEENKIHNILNKYYRLRKKIKLYLQKKSKKLSEDNVCKYNQYIYNINKKIQDKKCDLYDVFKKNPDIRHLDQKYLNKYNIVSMFNSTLSRVLNIGIDSLSEEIMIVKTFFFDVIEDIIINGFMYNNERYVCLTASAGQIRTKKTMFIKESSLCKVRNTLMCGLGVNDINKLGGVNVNKYLAYLALCNSATDEWKSFNIKKSIVVDDMETVVFGLVDFIDDTTYDITRKEMEIVINHTDGCGMILPKNSRKNFMARLPWIKGLLVSFPFDEFIKKMNAENPSKNYGIVKDIYGKEYNIIKDDIEIIFTKSQFKMYKYYSSWDQYCDNFIKYKCEAAMCNLEEDSFGNAKINYQMLQTLTDITDDEIEKICEYTNNDISNIGKDRKTMLKVLGITKSNINKNYYQQALEIYPQLLSDKYSREILKQTKKSMVKHAKAGRIDIYGTYTFIVPDLYAFCEYLFCGNKNPEGLLKNGEVFCKIYKDTNKLNCLRSPHLYREHAVRNNVVDDEKSKWFITNGLYTSCHDLISKILQFDVDGDKSLVCADETLIKVAERNMKDIVPLYYNMKKAGAEKLTNENIFKGLKAAYTGGHIGIVSNNITKIWNSDNINLDAIKLLCMENNFIIDYAKTLYKPVRPLEKNKLITSYTKKKTPHFFIYAKDKSKHQVESINNSVVNRLDNIIKNPRLNFNADNLGKFNFRMLMHRKQVEMDDNIINRYTELDLKSHVFINKDNDQKINNEAYIYQDIKNKILGVNPDIRYVVDVLVQYLYSSKKSSYKTTLWECFGDVIIQNLRENIIIGQTYCEKCGDLIEKNNNKKKYCDECAKKIKKIQDRIADKNYKKRQKARK